MVEQQIKMLNATVSLNKLHRRRAELFPICASCLRVTSIQRNRGPVPEDLLST